MCSSNARTNVIIMYRNLLRLARTLPSQKRCDAERQIKVEFRNHSQEHDPEKVAKMLEKANSSLGYLKIVTPKIRSRDPQAGATRITINEGNIHGGSGIKAVSNWHGGNLDPDSVSKHHHLLKRAGYKSHSDAKGIF